MKLERLQAMKTGGDDEGGSKISSGIERRNWMGL
jgi:hypothetical protein